MNPCTGPSSSSDQFAEPHDPQALFHRERNWNELRSSLWSISDVETDVLVYPDSRVLFRVFHYRLHPMDGEGNVLQFVHTTRGGNYPHSLPMGGTPFSPNRGGTPIPSDRGYPHLAQREYCGQVSQKWNGVFSLEFLHNLYLLFLTSSWLCLASIFVDFTFSTKLHVENLTTFYWHFKVRFYFPNTIRISFRVNEQNFL